MKIKMRHLLYVYVLGFSTLFACAAVQYKYYGVSMPLPCYDQGQLLGREGSGGWSDLPLSACKPDQIHTGKCLLQIDNDFYNEQRDLRKCHADLIICQKGAMPTS